MSAKRFNWIIEYNLDVFQMYLLFLAVHILPYYMFSCFQMDDSKPYIVFCPIRLNLKANVFTFKEARQMESCL